MNKNALYRALWAILLFAMLIPVGFTTRAAPRHMVLAARLFEGGLAGLNGVHQGIKEAPKGLQ